MLTHSEFTKVVMALHSVNIQELPDAIHMLIRVTRNGVAAEGQTLAAGDAMAQVVGPNGAGTTRRVAFKLGASSMKELNGVKGELVSCVMLAIQYTTQDFTVYDGLRTQKEQAAAVKAGNSQTMQSKHLRGLAVDLVPYINGKPTWDWNGCYRVALAMDRAATELGFAHKIRWGGAWDRTLADFGGDAGSYEQEVQLYQSRHPGKDFLDGPHFEWVD